ncbi:MAG: hypothetical protein FWC95_03080 [Defluviitaleaceae bacterium]|nr:hypothetical protein [Defluviitaleaceae bacterium]
MIITNGICGICRYYSSFEGDWVCTNSDSEFYTDWTEFEHGCTEFIKKAARFVSDANDEL